MHYETKQRSLLKAFSWRTIATVTTAILVYIFTGEFGIAITVGLLESVAKMALYFFHERAWHKIPFGQREIPSFVLWFTGLPASGKKALAERVYQRLKSSKLNVERIDSRGVRPLFPETGFTPPEVNLHIRRAGHLCSMLEKNGAIVVASFVSPYLESRQFARDRAKNFVEVYMRSSAEACEARDTAGRYEKARSGESPYFPGVAVPYEESSEPDPELIIDIDETDMDHAAEEIETYLRKRFVIPK